jgi:hypothetical protein
VHKIDIFSKILDRILMEYPILRLFYKFQKIIKLKKVYFIYIIIFLIKKSILKYLK